MSGFLDIKGEKMNRNTLKIRAVIVIMIMAFTTLFAGCDSFDPAMKITIDGDTFQLDCSVSEILNAGYELAEIDHKSGITKEYPEMEPRTLITSSIYLFKDDKPSHVAIYVYNKSGNTRKFVDCDVYGFKYDCGDYSHDSSETGYLDVKFNDIDVRFADRESVIASLESQGFKFKDADKTDFFKTGDAYSSSLIGPTGLLGHTLTVFNDYDYNSGERYINAVEFKIKVEYDTSGAWPRT